MFMRAGEHSSWGLLSNYFFMSGTPILAVFNLQNSINFNKLGRSCIDCLVDVDYES